MIIIKKYKLGYKVGHESETHPKCHKTKRKKNYNIICQALIKIVFSIATIY
jgi:hypothetical protein